MLFARTNETSEIYLAGPDGSGLLRLTRNRVADTSPSWSGDGERLVFSRGSADQRRSALFVMRRDGSGVRRLTSGRFFDFGPRWSPVDGRILFTRFDFAGPRFFVSIMVMDVAGRGKPRRLADGASGSWSSDSSQIAYTSVRDAFGQTCFHECGASGEIYVMRSDGKRERRVTRSRANDVSPSFVPGTRIISFTSDRSNRNAHADEVYLARLGLSCVRRITHTDSTVSDEESAWDPLGRPPSLPCR